MNLDEAFKNKVIVKLHLQVADLSVKLAEAEAKAELFKEMLEVREQELAVYEAKRTKVESKVKNSTLENEVK